jgi:hypothetical protein
MHVAQGQPTKCPFLEVFALASSCGLRNNPGLGRGISTMRNLELLRFARRCLEARPTVGYIQGRPLKGRAKN